jgi:hypothetical protein
MAYSTPTTRADDYVVDATEWNKNTVDNPIAIRTGGIAIAGQAANGIPYATSSSQFGMLAAGTAGQVLQTNGAGTAPSWANASASPSLCQGRLTLTSGTPVTNADVTAAGTLYWSPYQGNQVSIYSGTAWVTFAQAELSITVPAVANQVYDVFLNYNAGTPALVLTAWTNDTTRATALTTQNNILVKSGTLTHRYVGTVRTVSASQLNDSVLLRHVWNYYNRLPRELSKAESTDSWTYSTATIRQANGAAGNQVDLVIGVQEAMLDLTLTAHSANSTGVSRASGIGEDSTTTFASSASCNGADITPSTARLAKMPVIGRHFYAWNEWSAATPTTTFYGDTPDSTPAGTVSGLRGWVMG